MRYLFGFICVCALGMVPLVGCSETASDHGTGGSAGGGGSAGEGGTAGDGGGAGEGGDLCGGIDNVYDCIDEPLCTPTLTAYNCLNVSQEECAKNLERPADCPGFCHQGRDGLYFWDCVIFCEEDADCREGYECARLPEFGMLKGECSEACVDQCQQDADCPEGKSCILDYCGRCSPIVDACWDGEARFCTH